MQPWLTSRRKACLRIIAWYPHECKERGRPVSVASARRFMETVEREQQPAILLAQVFLYGAFLERRGHKPVLYLSLNWGGAGTAQVVIGSDLALAKTNCGGVGFRPPKLESFNLSPSTPNRMKTTSI